MPQNNFVLQLTATQMTLDMQLFMQDDAAAHNANKVLDFLRITSGTHANSHRFPDCNKCGHFLQTPQPRLEPM
jgi:hypothetical protein